MRTLGSVPIAGADEDFAVALALPAVKFVDWHRGSLGGKLGKLKGRWAVVAGCKFCPQPVASSIYTPCFPDWPRSFFCRGFRCFPRDSGRFSPGCLTTRKAKRLTFYYIMSYTMAGKVRRDASPGFFDNLKWRSNWLMGYIAIVPQKVLRVA